METSEGKDEKREERREGSQVLRFPYVFFFAVHWLRRRKTESAVQLPRKPAHYDPFGTARVFIWIFRYFQNVKATKVALD